MIKAAIILGIPDTLPPLTRREIRGYLWFGVAGLLLLALAVFPGSAAAPWTVVTALACWLIVPARHYFRRSPAEPQTDGARTLARQLRLYTAVVVVFSIGFAWWARQLGLTWPVVVGALFVIDAFANVIAALTEWWRLSMFGHSIGLMICGFAFPFVGQGSWALLVGTAVVTGSSLATAILYCQVRHSESLAASSCPPRSAG